MAFSPAPSYILGTACIGRGIMAALTPRNEYGRMGLRSPGAEVSPLMYLKALREVSYGLTLATLEHQGNSAAVTTFSAILSLVRIGDGLVVWLYGGEELKWKALGHWITGAGFLGWVIWRRQY